MSMVPPGVGRASYHSLYLFSQRRLVLDSLSSNSRNGRLKVMEQSSARQEGQRAEPDRVLIYDAQCRLCVAAKKKVEQLGKSLDVRWVPYQSNEAVRRLGAEYRAVRPDVAVL